MEVTCHNQPCLAMTSSTAVVLFLTSFLLEVHVCYERPVTRSLPRPSLSPLAHAQPSLSTFRLSAFRIQPSLSMPPGQLSLQQ